jgi:hypothetical protein
MQSIGHMSTDLEDIVGDNWRTQLAQRTVCATVNGRVCESGNSATVICGYELYELNESNY